jgi:hypothetical protein
MLNQGMYTPAPSSGVIVVGRAKGSGTTYYSIPGAGITTNTSNATVADTDYYAPWLASTPIIIDQLAIHVVTVSAGTVARIGFYAADTDWQPTGAPLADSGNLDTSTTGTKTYTPGSPISVPVGRYVSVLNSDTGTTTFTVAVASMSAYFTTVNVGPISRYSVGRAYAAFPTPGTAWTTIETGAGSTPHMVFYRVSTP